MSKILFISILIVLVTVQIATAQKTKDLDSIRETRTAARQELQDAKRQSSPNTASLGPADFNDTSSFGKNAKFLGSLYAGTVYVFRSCDPQILADEIGLVLAADDHCLVHNTSTPLSTTSVFDPVWQITIPGNTVDNVIYPMLNNQVGYDAFPSDPGAPGGNNGYPAGSFASIIFTPVVTIESTALNDPTAVHPTTGLPMGGSYTTSLAGTRFRSFVVKADDFIIDNDMYATVGGRGFSRTYFATLGLPQNVINNLFKRSMTLKFGIRADVNGPVQQAYFAYTFRLLGN
jgi:hypothetical protein